MKFRLKAGEWIDTLTAGELDEGFRSHEQRLRLWRSAQEAPRWIEADASGVTDASGDLTLSNVYRVPAGMEFRISRLLVDVDGYTAAAPFNGGGVSLLRDGKLKTFEGGPLPALLSIPEGAQPRARNGAQLDVQISAGPAATGVTVTIEGTLHSRES